MPMPVKGVAISLNPQLPVHHDCHKPELFSAETPQGFKRTGQHRICQISGKTGQRAKQASAPAVPVNPTMLCGRRALLWSCVGAIARVQMPHSRRRLLVLQLEDQQCRRPAAEGGISERANGEKDGQSRLQHEPSRPEAPSPPSREARPVSISQACSATLSCQLSVFVSSDP